MRIVLFGQAAFGKDVFDALREASEEIVGVSTPRPGEPLTAGLKTSCWVLVTRSHHILIFVV